MQELFDNAARAFEVKKRGPKRTSPEAQMLRKVEALEKKIAQKDEVMTEVVGWIEGGGDGEESA